MKKSSLTPEEFTKRQQVFTALLAEHHDAFARYVHAMARDAEDARDLMGETLLRAYEAFDTLREPSSFLFFLITIAKRLHWRIAKRRALHLPFERRHEDLFVQSADAAELAPDIAALHRAIARLPERQRETLVLFELSGLGLRDDRSPQGGTISGVKARLLRARRKLAELLGEAPVTERQAAASVFSEPVNDEVKR